MDDLITDADAVRQSCRIAEDMGYIARCENKGYRNPYPEWAEERAAYNIGYNHADQAIANMKGLYDRLTELLS